MTSMTTNPTRRTARTKTATTTEKLARKTLSKLTPQESHASGKQLSRAEPTPPTMEDERTSCMRMVNVSLQTLSAVTHSGRKFTPEEIKNAHNKNADASKVDDATRNAKRALQRLREINPDDLDVERAACSISGKLIALELYEEAIQFLDGMYPRLLRMTSVSQSGDPSPLHLLSLPRPDSVDSTVLTLLITSITHALNSLLSLLLRPFPPITVGALATTLQRSHSLLNWAPDMKRHNIPEKTRDALLTKAYTFTNKVCTALSSNSKSSADPEPIFHLRMYGLSCLLYTSPGTIKSETFWDQVHKTCLAYARTFSSESVDEKGESTLAARVSHTLSAVVRLAEGLYERSFVEGRSFVRMCETWMSFAQKGDISMLDHISALMGIPCSSSTSGSNSSRSDFLSSPCSVDNLANRIGDLKISELVDAKSVKSTFVHITKDTMLVECVQLCVIFIKATASLESEGPDLSRHAKEATAAVHGYCKLLSSLDAFTSGNSSQPSTTSSAIDSTPSSADAEVARARSKLERALERLRRAGLRVLDAHQVQNDGSRHAAAFLLEAIAVALEGSLAQGKGQCAETRSVLTSLVDVFFALARSRLQPADIESCTPALSYLQRAVAAVDGALTRMIIVDDAATLLRCISGTLHNLGGVLYTAGRLGGAVRFLKEGCSLGRRVLAMYGNTPIGEQGEKSDREKDGRQQLEEQLFRRYELLGVCHSKIGDRKLAYECFVESVRTFPFTHHLPAFSSADPFVSGAPLALKQLSSIVERLTYAATCELFLPPAQITLRHFPHALETDSGLEQVSSPPISTFPLSDRPKAEVAGAILMHQLATLETIGHKDGAREAIGRVLEDLLSVYDASWAQVRRARVLVAGLGASWRDPDASTVQSQMDVDEMGREVLTLLEREVPESEGLTFTNLIPQLRVSANMWLALHAYRRSSAGAEMMNVVAAHVEAAYDVLGGILTGLGSGSEGKTSTEANAKEKSTGTNARARGTSKKERPAGDSMSRNHKKAAAASAVKSQPRTVLQAVSLNTRELTPSNSIVVKKPATTIDLHPILGLIQMNVHLLGLLGLIVLKVKLLEVLKRVCESQASDVAEAYSIICVDLAHEYVKLGKPKRASALFSKCANVLKASEVPDEVRLRYLLGRAEVLALGGNILTSASAYHDAQSLEAAMIVEDKTMPTARRIRARVERLERAALACRVFAAVQYAKDNVVGVLSSMLQSLRLWNRAVDALARLAPPSTSGSRKAMEGENANPFEVPSDAKQNGDDQDQQHQVPSTTTKPTSTPTPTDALSWRLLSHLVSTLFSLAHAYLVRGSPREALYFVQQAQELAESARAPAVVARALLLRGEVLLGQTRGEGGPEALEEGMEALEKAACLLGGGAGTGVGGIDAADVQRLWGDYGALSCGGAGEQGGRRAMGGPREYYERAGKMLDELEQRIVSFDGGRRRSSIEPVPMGGTAVVNGGQGMVVPRLLSAILGRHIWLLRNDGDDRFKDLIERMMGLPPSAEIKGEEHAIMGKLTLHSVYERFSSDMFLSSLTESAIALPMGMSVNSNNRALSSLVPATQDILGVLDDADKLFWADLKLTSRSGAVPHVREAAVSLAMIRALQSSLGKVSKDAPLLAARLLDASSAITLHREMLEAIPYKLGDMHVDDLEWPLMTTDGSPLARNNTPSLLESEGSRERLQRTYWTALEKKYASLVLSPTSLLEATIKLPHNWTVIHITLTPDKSSMFISRVHTPSSQPLMFCVPLRGRRDVEEESRDGDDTGNDGEGGPPSSSRLTLENALGELREIVRLSDEGTRRAVHVKSDDVQARTGWWAERAALDRRLQALLENIEFCWLGAFKTILSPPTTPSGELINDLRTRLEKVFRRSLVGPQDKRKKKKVALDDALVSCFSSLSPKCRDEELEDMAYFILDMYQFHGEPIAISEVDMDQVTMDLRAALEEHTGAKKKAKVPAEVVEDSHTFLVLDRALQGIPWESLPVLRGQSVSRIPSMEFLVDRLRLAEMERRGAGEEGGDGDGEIDRIRVDGRKAWYVLNPSGDLKGTEGRFSGWLKEMHRVGWDGVIGRAPSEQEMLNALSRRDLVIYFGHGGGEQYVRSHKIRHLPRCAATMLWGCSSGALRDMGEFDRVGTPYNYMIGGCPTLVANLWDVTDRDIDKITQGVFDQLDFGTAQGRVSVVAAVARARDMCKLKYLTGAAPVVYGIPFYL